MDKRLYKSRKDRVLFGVCGGVAEYFDVDPTIIRLATVLIWMTGGGFLAYILAAIIMPEPSQEPTQSASAKAAEQEVVVEADSEEVES